MVLPTIIYSVQGPNLILNWTTTDLGFKLQSTVTVNSGWADDPATETVVGNTHTVTVPLGSAAKFYRLKK